MKCCLFFKGNMKGKHRGQCSHSVLSKLSISLSFILFLSLLFILLASPKKQTNKQKERWQGHCNSCGQLQRAWILIKKIKTRNIKNTAIQEKLLLHTTSYWTRQRNEHYYFRGYYFLKIMLVSPILNFSH